MNGKPNINTGTVRGLAATYVRAAQERNERIPGGLLMRDTIPGLCDEVDHLRQECRDRDAVEQDLRARLADAEKALARVRGLADQWADKRRSGALSGSGLLVAALSAASGDLRDALDGKP